MNYLLLLFFISILLKSKSEHGMIIRNISLRFLIACKYKMYKTKLFEMKNNILQSIYQTHDKSLLIYNDYYQLSEDDRLFIETILGLIF